VIAVGAECLRIRSWNLVNFGVAYVASSIFQGLGHTLPPFASSALRLVLFAVPAYLLSLRAGFHIREVYLSVGSVAVQVVLKILLLRREFDRTLRFDACARGGDRRHRPVRMMPWIARGACRNRPRPSRCRVGENVTLSC
jgi:hypothetical protein